MSISKKNHKAIAQKYVGSFNAIKGFVDDLWAVYGNKTQKMLALYRRLISHINPKTDAEPMNKVLSGFRQFLATYEDAIMKNRLDTIPRGTVIKYGPNSKFHLEIQKYIYKSLNDKETLEVIRQHLVTISAILEPDTKKIDELKKIDDVTKVFNDGSNEGDFIMDIMDKAKDSMENINTDNPTQAIAGLMQSGIIQKLTVGLKHGVESGEMDMSKLLMSMQTAIGSLIPQNIGNEKQEKIENVKNKTS